MEQLKSQNQSQRDLLNLFEKDLSEKEFAIFELKQKQVALETRNSDLEFKANENEKKLYEYKLS